MKKVVILGVGGYCANLIDVMHDINEAAGREEYTPLGFLDDDPKKIGTWYHGCEVLAPLSAARRFPEALFVNGIGSAENASRKRDIIGQTGLPPERFITLIHPSSYLARSARVGRGTVVAQNCVIMAGASIGDHVKMLPSATISYGSSVGDYSTVSSGVITLSDVQVGSSCYLGANVTIRERVCVGDGCILGMGAVVIRDVADHSVVVGNPARWLRSTLDAAPQPAERDDEEAR